MSNNFKVSEDKKEFMRLGYEVSLRFQVESTSYNEVKQLLHIIDQYNKFDSGTVWHYLKEFLPKCSRVIIGRESSPVLYVKLPYWRNQAMGYRRGEDNERILDDEREALATDIIQAMIRAKADEYGRWSHGYVDCDEDYYSLRFWWD